MSSEPVHATLCDLARAEIELLAEEGIACTADDVVLLNALAWEVETPSHRQALSRGTPVFVGGAALWPMTLAADEWWQRAVTTCPRSQERQSLYLAFAMAHSRRQETLDDLDPVHAWGKVSDWRKGLSCRSGELAVAVALVIAQDQGAPTVKDHKTVVDGLTAAQLVAVLVAATGDTPDFWERQVAIGYLREQFRAIHAQAAAEHGGCLRDSEVVYGTRQLGLASEAIRARHRQEVNPS